MEKYNSLFKKQFKEQDMEDQILPTELESEFEDEDEEIGDHPPVDELDDDIDSPAPAMHQGELEDIGAAVASLDDEESEEDNRPEPQYDNNGMMVIDHADEAPTKNKLLDIRYPMLMLNFPAYLSNSVRNNVWMSKESKDEEQINLENAWKQWIDFYSLISNFSITYLLPSEQGLQDQSYVANIGFKIPGDSNNDYVLSNFRSSPRTPEEDVARSFMNLMKYDVAQSPYFFEGEADLKYLRENICIGGYGIRSDLRTYKWMQEKYGLKIIPVKMTDDYLYHLDCSIFTMSQEQILMCTELYEEDEVARVEEVAEILDVPADLAYNGITNSVLCSKTVFMPSNIDSLEKDDEMYHDEVDKVNLMGKYCSNLGLELVLVDISEYYKSGAMLSCLVGHLNYFGKV